jgi:ribose transport system substrate-binding protein
MPVTARKRLALPVVVAVSTLLVACSANPASPGAAAPGSSGTASLSRNCGTGKTFTIGFAQANNAEPYRQHVNAELKALAGAYPQFQISIADGQGSSSKQVSDVENFRTQQVDLLMISPFEAQPLTAPVSVVHRSGTPVIELDRQTTGQDYTAFVGGDNRDIGRQAGEFVATKLLPGGGDVAVLQGLPSTTPAIDRTEGFAEGVASNPRVKLVATQPADWLPDKAQTVFDAMLRATPSIRAVYANNDLMASGAYLAVKGAGKVGQVQIVGTDGLPGPAGGASSVLTGQMSATFVYPTGVAAALDLAKKILVDCATSVPRTTVVPTQLITRDVAEKFTVEARPGT